MPRKKKIFFLILFFGVFAVFYSLFIPEVASGKICPECIRVGPGCIWSEEGWVSCQAIFTNRGDEEHTADEWCNGATTATACSNLSFDFCSARNYHVSFGCDWNYDTGACVCDSNSFHEEDCLTHGCFNWDCTVGQGCAEGDGQEGKCYTDCNQLCTNWADDKCGGWTCNELLMHQSRECDPVIAGCPLDQCVPDDECAPSWYPVCPTCLCGPPECKCSAEEIPDHFVCQADGSCVLVPGAGTNECYSDADCSSEVQCLKCVSSVCEGSYATGCTDDPDCQGKEEGDSCVVGDGVPCHYPDCCYLNVETAVALTEGGKNAAYTIINEALNYCEPGKNWVCLEKTAPNYNEVYSSEKKCEDNCVGITGAPLIEPCSCFWPFDAETKFNEITTINYGPWTYNCSTWEFFDIIFNLDPVCWTLRLLDFPYNSGTETVTIEGEIEAGEALWKWVLKPFIASQIQDYSVIGSEECETCITYEGEKNVILRPVIHIPENFCLVPNLVEGTCAFGNLGTKIPVIGGQKIQLTPGICAWLYNMGYVNGGRGYWGDIWVNLNPFVRAETLDELINNFINFFLLIGLPLALLFFILGGVMFMTASGAPERVGLARRIILYTAIGLVVILFAKGLIFLIQRIIGG